MNSVNIEDFLSTNQYTTREELCNKTGLTDRKVREKISELKLNRVVIYSSHRSGYRLAKEISKMDIKEREEEMRLVQQSLNENMSRVKKQKKQMRKYIAYLKKAEQISREEKENV